MATFLKSFAGKRVLVTGHTGFKGSWLSEWLIGLGSEVWGFSLPPATRPSLFTQLGLEQRLNHIIGDLRDSEAVKKAVAASRPDLVFHLAAQPIVRTAHAQPAMTWATNVMGTVHLLEALRTLTRPCSAVIVTTDKVYGASPKAHAEHHTIKASDPYGSSKAAVELAVAAWRETYFSLAGRGKESFPNVALATARAGNVIGGGDWAKDRLVPDCVRALSRNRPVSVRSPDAIRPWQHVLDPLAGYLLLGAKLSQSLNSGNRPQLAELSGAFNFGPGTSDHRTVASLVDEVISHWPGHWTTEEKPSPIVESGALRLDARKARRILGWKPRWRFEESVFETVSWYRYASSPSAALEITRRQLSAFGVHH
jgi:CDP-glucose 4,6-dehydratase